MELAERERALPMKSGASNGGNELHKGRMGGERFGLGAQAGSI